MRTAICFIAALLGAGFIGEIGAVEDKSSLTTLTTCTNIKPDSPLYSRIPTNFHLVPPCPRSGEIHGALDDFHFEGETIINGNIHYSDTYTFGPFASFDVDEKSKQLLPFGHSSLRIKTWDIIESAKIAVKTFHLPALKGEGRNCWIAPSSLRVRAIWLSGGDNDSSGMYLTKFEVLHVGKFSACKAETDNK